MLPSIYGCLTHTPMSSFEAVDFKAIIVLAVLCGATGGSKLLTDPQDSHFNGGDIYSVHEDVDDLESGTREWVEGHMGCHR